MYMETTKISAERTAQEIAMLLAQAGATAVLTEFGKDRKISGLSFKLLISDRQVPFTLPARIEPVFKYLQKKKSPRSRQRKELSDKIQAERVAWRQLYRWIEAQLAMIDTGMVQAGEVFLPYVQVAPNKTLWERAMESGKLALPAAAEER